LTIDLLRSPFDVPQRLVLVPKSNVSTDQVVEISAKIHEVRGKKVGYVRLWNLMSMNAISLFRKKTTTTFQACDAIVVDLRGRGGMVPAISATERAIKALEIPVICITDELTRSAKEMLTFRLKKLENVTVIGEKTSGAVTAATFRALPSGNMLMYPAASAESLKAYIDGQILEGVGVEPDEPFVFFEPYCNGNDRLLAAALNRAVEIVEVNAQSQTRSPNMEAAARSK